MESRKVELRGPADQGFIRLVRTATLSVASQAGFAVDPCDELRIAADEACNVLVGAGATSLVVVFEDSPTQLIVTICSNDGVTISLDATSELVLTTMVDNLIVQGDGTIVLQKASVA